MRSCASFGGPIVRPGGSHSFANAMRPERSNRPGLPNSAPPALRLSQDQKAIVAVTLAPWASRSDASVPV